MPAVTRRKSSRVRPRQKAAIARRKRQKTIEPIPIRRVGELPVSDLELELEKLAGPDATPDFER